MGALGGLVGRNAGSRDGSGQYNALQNGASTEYQGIGASTGDLYGEPGGEKSAWLAKQGASSKRWKGLIIAAVTLLIAAAIALGVYFGVFRNKMPQARAAIQQQMTRPTMAISTLTARKSRNFSTMPTCTRYFQASTTLPSTHSIPTVSPTLLHKTMSPVIWLCSRS
jgi:hypothetical protein